MINDTFNQECIKAHNVRRDWHNTASLTYDKELAKRAQAWANVLASKGALAHSSDREGTLGENVAMKWASGQTLFTGDNATEQWYSEINDYTFGKENQVNCGHFTQVVWKGTKEAGFGVATAKNGGIFVVGQYRPAGNMVNTFTANVQPLKPGAPQPKPAAKSSPKPGASPAASSGEDQMIGQSSKTMMKDGKKVVTTEQKFRKADGSEYVVTKTQVEGCDDVSKLSGDLQKMSGPSGGAQPKKSPPVPKDMKTFCAEVLKRHNELRVKHSAHLLKINEEMSVKAQAWADNLGKTNKFMHSEDTYQGKDLGENIACASGANGIARSGDQVVDQWYAEIKDYKWGDDNNYQITGHFTQVVWKGSKELGIGRCYSEAGKEIVVCNYFPPGNTRGRYETQVLPLKE